MDQDTVRKILKQRIYRSKQYRKMGSKYDYIITNSANLVVKLTKLGKLGALGIFIKLLFKKL